MSHLFDFEKEYVLENERVLLRPLHQDDLANLLPFALHEPTTWKFSLVTAAGEENMRAYLDLALNMREQHKEYPFIVFDKQTQRYAGSTRFYDINLPFQTLQLGYTWYGEKFRGTGLNRNCKYLLFQFAFEQIDMLRVELRAHSENARSIAAMKALGCKVDGILRNNMPEAEGVGRRSSIVLSVLKEEWP
jgi:RimJ/RimL family protein N-acetyltransferase